MASRSRWVPRTFSDIGACEDGRVMVRLLCRGLQTAHCKPADQHRQLASAIGRQFPPGHLLARLARAHDEPRSSARAPVAPRCRAAAASSTGMTLQGFRWGWLENHIKSWKTHLAADRTSCTKATANQFHLFLHAGAYWLLWSLRALMPKRSLWRVVQFDTLRLRLIKIAARVVELKTQIRLHLPTACPDQAILRVVLGRIPRLVT